MDEKELRQTMHRNGASGAQIERAVEMHRLESENFKLRCMVRDLDIDPHRPTGGERWITRA